MVVRGLSKLSLLALLTVSCVVVSVAPAEAVTNAERNVAIGIGNKITAARIARFGIQGVPEWSFMSIEAENHSAYQAAQKRISHDGFCDDTNGDEVCDTPPGDGISGNTRIERIWAAGSGIGYVCENVAVTVNKPTVAKAVKALFKLWDLSPPHNACMFHSDTDWMGIGIKRKGTSKWYATLLAGVDSSPAQP